MPREGARRSRRFWRRLVLAVAASLALSLTVGALTYAWDRQRKARSRAAQNADIASSLRTGLATPVESLYALQAFLGVERGAPLTLARFREFCGPAVRRHPEIAALEWFPLVRGEDRAAFEALVAREQVGFEIREPTRAGPLVRAVPRPEHVPLTFMEPPLEVVRGLDLAFDPERIAPVKRALSLERPTLSDRFQLVEDPPNVLSVAAYAPVTKAVWAGVAPGERKFERGVAVALFRLSPLIQSALRGRDLEGLSVELWDPHAPEAARLLYRSGSVSDSGERDEAEVPFVDRKYRLVVHANGPQTGLAPLFAFGGTLLFCFGALALVDARRKARRLARAAERLGQYQLEERIASGGMGTVYRARHALLRRPTAIKIAHEEQAAATFEKEVLVTSTLTHPNTVVVYDFGRGEDGAFYCAMEFIDGYDLEQLVRDHGPLPPARVIRLLLQATGSLAEAHDKGLVHRDIKPSNLMVTERGGTHDFLKVLDFGLARAQSDARSGGSAAVSVGFAGTPGYVAPEVIAGSPASPRSDVFSLGAVGYFLVTGRGPFTNPSSATDSLTRTLTAEPEPLPNEVPEGLARLLLSCLRKNADERPLSMVVLGERLREELAACAPWTRADAERWWREHPHGNRKFSPSSVHRFVPAGREVPLATRSSAQSDQSR